MVLNKQLKDFLHNGELLDNIHWLKKVVQGRDSVSDLIRYSDNYLCISNVGPNVFNNDSLSDHDVVDIFIGLNCQAFNQSDSSLLIVTWILNNETNVAIFYVNDIYDKDKINNLSKEFHSIISRSFN